MNSNEVLDKKVAQSLEDEISKIDEEKLPQIISQRIDILAEANKQIENAKEREKYAKEKVDEAVKQADAMIEKAKKLGKLKPEQHKLLGMTWSNKEDRIRSLEENLKVLAEYGGESAEYQKELAQIQKALLDSQEATLNLQKTQMEYLELVADISKFLYGLCVYSVASTQSIVTNLEAILGGAKKKELGEMAKQQMFLVMDQLKCQENILTRLDDNDAYMDYIDSQVHQNQEKISALEIENETLKKNDLIYEEQLKEEIASGKKQDEVIKKQQEKDIEHDRLIAEGVAKDQEQDQLLRNQQEKDVEHDELISRLKLSDTKQNEELFTLSKRIEELDIALKECSDAVPKKNMVYISTLIAIVAATITLVQFFI